MRKLLVGLTVVAGLFVGSAMSASAASEDVANHVVSVPAHEQQHGEDARTPADGLCTAYYAIMGERGNHHPLDN